MLKHFKTILIKKTRPYIYLNIWVIEYLGFDWNKIKELDFYHNLNGHFCMIFNGSYTYFSYSEWFIVFNTPGDKNHSRIHFPEYSKQHVLNIIWLTKPVIIYNS